MRQVIILILCAISSNLFAQKSDTEHVQKTIETFFEGFHQKDSLMIKQTVSENIILQTIAKSAEGEAYVRTDDFRGFLMSVVGIPDSTQFQEKIKGYSVQVDGPMANAWTPYEFWLNGTFSHCGVNSFQLFKVGDHWKIIYLIDTRRKEGCD